ncbi:hypothetical protein Tco_1566739 [Tanacetum coccineum]
MRWPSLGVALHVQVVLYVLVVALRVGVCLHVRVVLCVQVALRVGVDLYLRVALRVGVALLEKELILLMVKVADLEISMHGDYYGLFVTDPKR